MADASLDEILTNSRGGWLEGTGPQGDVVLSSRVRLARNVDGIPFPHAMTPEQGRRLLQLAEEATAELNRFGHFGTLRMYRLDEMSLLDRHVLVEKHLVSPQHARKANQAAVILRADECISVMVNEEDHFRIQCLLPGMQLSEALETACRIDDVMEEKVRYAFEERRGFLTACPTNVGTGIRASTMMHLPGLVLTNQAGRVLNAMAKVGIMVRGFYGEGTEARGNIFQVSNQITLGQTEEEIVSNLSGVTLQIVRQERDAREALVSERRTQLEDRVGRAYGILSNARSISSEEATRLISEVRLGVDLGMIKGVSPATLNQLLVLIRPAFLQKRAGRELGPAERDERRAGIIRERLAAG